MAFSIPRVRTHHTNESSRFAYALVPRPHIKVWRACMKSVRLYSRGAERALAKRETTGRFLSGNLLDDFWYFWSYKST